MTIDSLSVFSRVRLYTAIYPEGDVADFTEDFSQSEGNKRSPFPVISLSMLPVKRLPSVNPLRYESPIALILGSKINISPSAIAQRICQGSIASGALSWNEAGWITLTWAERDLWAALAKICAEIPGGEGNDLPSNLPFGLWQVGDRVRSLREQLQSQHPEFEQWANTPSENLEHMGQMPDPVQDLLESIVIFLDRLSDGPDPKNILGFERLYDGFERMHRRMPLFSPTMSVADRYAAWLVMGWFHQILNISKITDK